MRNAVTNCFYEAFAVLYISLAGTFGIIKKEEISLPLIENLFELRRCKTQLDAEELRIEQQIETTRKRAMALRANGRKDASMTQKIRQCVEDLHRLNTQQERIRTNHRIIDSQIDVIETSELTRSVTATLRSTTDAMRRVSGSFDIAQVEETMSDLEEQMQTITEATNLISTPMGESKFSSMDYTDLENELDDLLCATTPSHEYNRTTPLISEHSPVCPGGKVKLPTSPVLGEFGMEKIEEEEEEEGEYVGGEKTRIAIPE
jgi:hypothetical protein